MSSVTGTGTMYVASRSRLMEVFPPEVKEVWNKWQVRVLILASLILQLVLFKLGSRRKRIAKVWIKATLWTTYLLADWVAIVALGVISKNMEQGCRCKDKDQDHHPINKGARNYNRKDLNAFWAPFLLLHLGGPDTITAYSLEDNELWRRHLLILVPQLGVTVYILLMACRPGSVSWVSISSFLMMVPGVIKYVERTWALRMANTENFRASMLTSPDSGPNYRKFVEEFSLRKAEGFYVKVDEVVEEVIHQQPRHHHDDGAAGQQSLVPIAYNLFQIFRRLFVDLILSFQDREHSQKIFMDFSTQAAFQVVEIELGFAYDVFYTKAPVLFSCAGCILRLISFSFTFSVSVLFLAVELLHTDCNRDILADCIITCLLLIAGVVLEIYAVCRLLRSDWAEYYYYYYYHHHHRWLTIITNNLGRKLLHRGNHEHRWSNSMAQYNLLSFSLQYKPAMWEGAQKFLGIHDKLEQHRHTSFVPVSMELKDLIFKRFLEASKDADNRLTALSKFRGGLVLEDEGRRPSYRWSDTVEFDQSVLTWHVATDICLRSGRDQRPPEGGSGTVAGRVLSEHLSNYMLYLLVMCPLTFPIGIGMIRFKDTCAEAKDEKQRDPTRDLNEYCERLLQVNTDVLPEKVKGDRSKSVLFDACRTAKLLLSMETRKSWETMSHAWVEILAYAAMHCRGNNHARQLRKGGELLTHVWLLMAHLGITDQFQIKRGHVRAKLRLQ